jgi:hypothetical protein
VGAAGSAVGEMGGHLSETHWGQCRLTPVESQEHIGAKGRVCAWLEGVECEMVSGNDAEAMNKPHATLL